MLKECKECKEQKEPTEFYKHDKTCKPCRLIKQRKGVKPKKGYIYCLTNKAFTGWVKVGLTTNPKHRLDGYNTGDPFRAYAYEYLHEVDDVYEAERSVHGVLNETVESTYEWFNLDVDQAIKIIKETLE